MYRLQVVLILHAHPERRESHGTPHTRKWAGAVTELETLTINRRQRVVGVSAHPHEITDFPPTLHAQEITPIAVSYTGITHLMTNFSCPPNVTMNTHYVERHCLFYRNQHTNHVLICFCGELCLPIYLAVCTNRTSGKLTGVQRGHSHQARQKNKQKHRNKANRARCTL